MNVSKQRNGSDCGVYSIAFATAILHGEDPTQQDYIRPREHLLQCFEAGNISPFPCAVQYHGHEVLWQTDENIFCICRRIDVGETMLACNICDQWYRGTRVGQKEVLEDQV